MAVQIQQKIVGYSLADKSAAEPVPAPVVEVKTAPAPIPMEAMARPEELGGCTYKLKTPASDAAMYITINDVVMNPGTPEEHRRPFEIFINSKNMEHFQWMVALTRVISAVFRKGGDCTFLVEELGSVFAPQGGYFKKGGKYMPSLVAELGEVLRNHFVMIGMMEQEGLDEHQQKLVDEKRAEYLASSSKAGSAKANLSGDGYPEGAQLCNKCNTKAAIVMDGCLTCLSCGDSKCG